MTFPYTVPRLSISEWNPIGASSTRLCVVGGESEGIKEYFFVGGSQTCDSRAKNTNSIIPEETTVFAPTNRNRTNDY